MNAAIRQILLASVALACLSGAAHAKTPSDNSRASDAHARSSKPGKLPAGDLLTAAATGNVERVKLFLAAKIDPNTADGEGRTALMLTDNAEVTKALIGAKADVDAKDALGRTALMLADNPESVKALIGAHADLNATIDRSGARC